MFIFEKPWQNPGLQPFEERRSREEIRLGQMQLGLKFLLAAMSMLFFMLCVAYLVRMKVQDWQALQEPWLLWVNSVVLCASSLVMQWSVKATQYDNQKNLWLRFFIAGLLAWAFVLGQLLAWKQLLDSGQMPEVNPANTFFYLLTAFHGVHLLGGLLVWSYCLAKMRRLFDMVEVRSSVRLCAFYWHFLLLVWIVLYSLLLLT